MSHPTPLAAAATIALAALIGGCATSPDAATGIPPAVGDKAGRHAAKGEIVFAEDFSAGTLAPTWTEAPFAEIVAGGQDASPCLKITVLPDNKEKHHKVSAVLDLDRIRGCTLYFEADIKADDVPKAPSPWNGIKYMFHAQTGSGPVYQNRNDVYGTFDWKRIGFMAHVPEDATEAYLFLGLEETTGTVHFDNLAVTVMYPKEEPLPPSPHLMYRGHDLPRLRGVMSPQEFKDSDLKTLGLDWKANVIRWQLTWVDAYLGGKPEDAQDMAKYNQWLDAELADLDKVVDACERYGIMVVIDLHLPPGGRLAELSNTHAMFLKPEYMDEFLRIWQMIAARYKDKPSVWGYDMLNEPILKVPTPAGACDWQETARRTAREIRKIDPHKAIIMESEDYAAPHAFKWLKPLDVPGMVYSVHMYEPGTFTHQTLYGIPAGATYPGMIGGKYCDKNTLRAMLQPVRDFQLRHNAHIFVGEFSAIRWADGAERYLSDLIDIFEDYGWDWTYHAYREWHGWSVEHGSDKNDDQPSATDTDRKKLLLHWFGKNVAPARPAAPTQD
jgi:hypothetical protein